MRGTTNTVPGDPFPEPGDVKPKNRVGRLSRPLGGGRGYGRASWWWCGRRAEPTLGVPGSATGAAPGTADSDPAGRVAVPGTRTRRRCSGPGPRIPSRCSAGRHRLRLLAGVASGGGRRERGCPHREDVEPSVRHTSRSSSSSSPASARGGPARVVEEEHAGLGGEGTHPGGGGVVSLSQRRRATPRCRRRRSAERRSSDRCWRLASKSRAVLVSTPAIRRRLSLTRG